MHNCWLSTILTNVRNADEIEPESPDALSLTSNIQLPLGLVTGKNVTDGFVVNPIINVSR